MSKRERERDIYAKGNRKRKEKKYGKQRERDSYKEKQNGLEGKKEGGREEARKRDLTK